MPITIKKPKNIHFIGIGGIGMSALAKFYLAQEARISGSDAVDSEITRELTKAGVKISIGEHSSKNVPPKVDLLVYTAAINKNNPELTRVKTTGGKIRRYSETIGEITKKQFTIAIAGAHGKSTTTALVSNILIEGELDPTVIIGTKLNEFGGSNFRQGQSKYFVIEADEYAGSFLKYKPDIAVVTNIDKEHLDFYKNITEIRGAFKKFLLHTKPKGFLVLNRDNDEVLKLGISLSRLAKFKNNIRWYSLSDAEADAIKKIIRIPGEHNISNALAAYRTGEILGVERNIILRAISRYQGAWRRFEYKGELNGNGAKIFDDYAHHPAEVKATLSATREKFPRSRIWCVFQPHQRQRLTKLFDEFVPAFDNAHEVVILDPYEVRGRENTADDTGQTSSFELAVQIDKRLKNNVYYIPYSSQVSDFIKRYTNQGDVVIMMGAGDIWQMTKELI